MDMFMLTKKFVSFFISDMLIFPLVEGINGDVMQALFLIFFLFHTLEMEISYAVIMFIDNGRGGNHEVISSRTRRAFC